VYSESRQKGNIGENIACLFLMRKGYEIIDRNFLKPWGEIDIIAEKAGKLHFVEVKSTRTQVSRESVTRETIRPEDNMTEGKGLRLGRAIKTYLIECKVSHETEFQMDLVTVRFDSESKTAIVELFERVI
jgi:putative endonuclease